MARRIVAINFDVNTLVLREDDGALTRRADMPYITFGEEVTVQLQLVTDENSTKYTGLTGSVEFQAQIDKEFSTPLLMTTTLNAGINQPGDWKANGTANAANGEISIRINALTLGFQYKIRQNKENPGTELELIALAPVGQAVQQIFRMPFRTLGTLFPIAVITPPVPTSSSLLIPFVDPASGQPGVRLVNEDGQVLQVFLPPGV